MSDQALQVILWGGGIGIAMISGLLGLVIMLLTRTADRNERVEEGRGREGWRTRDKQVTQGELVAGVVARVAKLEDGHSKIAEALDRLTRLEEFRIHAMPKLEEAEETARTVIAFGEQMKTVFKRIDVMSEQMNKQSDKIDRIPTAVATELRGMIRVAPAGRAANG